MLFTNGSPRIRIDARDDARWISLPFTRNATTKLEAAPEAEYYLLAGVGCC